MRHAFLILTGLLLVPLAADDSRHPDVLTIPADLENPAITSGEPAPGRMVLQSLPSYAGTEVAHTVYLPRDWEKGKLYPVIIEYLGNNSRVRDNSGIGHALSGGKGFIWAVLPFVSPDGKQDMKMWWGDVKATVAYANEAVPTICRQWGGDPAQVILTGYSRGAIACNYIGLHDDKIAKLWRAVVAVSHYDDGHTAWGMTPEERSGAPERLLRLGKTPQLICGEYSSRSARGSDAKLLRLIKDKNLTTFAAAKTELELQPLTKLEGTRQFVARHHPQGNFTILDSAWVNHGSSVLFRDTPERRQLRDWLQRVILAADLPPASPGIDAYARRIELVRQTPGLVAFWDFVKREEDVGGSGRFLAHTAAADEHRHVLEPHNISRDFWREGEVATLADFPLLGRGPFGQAVQFRDPKAINDIPVLMVPRAKLHDTPLDIKGPGKSVSMVVWLVHQAGNHAIAGMWHEGTDTPPTGPPAVVQERGQRQFGMFGGLAANPQASSAHISENGLASFGDRYARHLAVTKEKMKSVKPEATPEEIDAGWSAVGFVFDNAKNTVTAYLNGNATEYWVDEPAKNRFYRSAEGAWRQARLAAIPGLQPGENPRFPRDQFYAPSETALVKEEVVSQTEDHRVVVRTYEFTKVRLTLQKDAEGKFTVETATDLVALKANPYWFGHDIYTPPSSTEGSPFTIGRVIHSNRHTTLSAFIGGVAVFDQPLTPAQMRTLADIGTMETKTEPAILKFTDLSSSNHSK